MPFRESPSLFLPRAEGLGIHCGGVGGSRTLLPRVDRNLQTVRDTPPISAAVWALLWILYLSFVNVGQTFYGFGWESILLEAGFYTIFLGSRASAPQWIAILLLRWLCFRVMFGAGLIKLRGDPCWKDMTCLDYHYETQPPCRTR